MIPNAGSYARLSGEALKSRGGPAKELRRFSRSLLLSSVGTFLSFNEDHFLRLLYCHYVFDDQVQRFKLLMETLTRWGKFVDTKTCLSMLRLEKPIVGRNFHLSFDDGFRNIFLNALPVLREMNVPALLFVPTSLVDADWKTASAFSVDSAHYSGVLEMVKWSELREALSWGFEVASHSRSHRRLSALSSQELESEILGSKIDIEKKIGQSCEYISWPYGQGFRVVDQIRAAGYVASFEGVRGSIKPGVTDLFRIPRHHIEVQWPFSHVKYFLSGKSEEP